MVQLVSVFCIVLYIKYNKVYVETYKKPIVNSTMTCKLKDITKQEQFEKVAYFIHTGTLSH